MTLIQRHDTEPNHIMQLKTKQVDTIGEIISYICVLKIGFTVTSGAFYGQAEGKTYVLTLSDLGVINGTIEVINASHNIDVGLICDGKFYFEYL